MKVFLRFKWLIMMKNFFIYSIILSVPISSILLFSEKSEAIPLEPILNQLIERVLGINSSSSYPPSVPPGDSSGGYQSPETVPQAQNPSYSNYPQTQQSYPQQQYPQQSYPQQYLQQPYYPQSPYPQQQYPQQSMPTQPFIYNPVFMIPPQVNNFNNH